MENNFSNSVCTLENDSASKIATPEFWRNVTPEQVENVIKDSLLGRIYFKLQEFYTPKAPCSVCLVQAVLLMAIALVHKNPDLAECPTDLPGSDGTIGSPDVTLRDLLVSQGANSDSNNEVVSKLLAHATPASRSGIYIDTMTGNVPNVFALVVAPSGFGKSLGLFKQLMRAVNYAEINAASLAGIYEAAMQNPHLLISLQEFGSYLKTEWKTSQFKTSLTDMFSAGSFCSVTGQANNCNVKSSDWFYPSVTASIQPDVFKQRGCLQDLTQGLLTRFLVANVSEEEAKCNIVTKSVTQDKEILNIARALAKLSIQKKVVKVPDPNYNIEFMEPVLPLIDQKLVPVLRRYGCEYLPRIALMLAIPYEYDGTPIPELTKKHMASASIVMQYFLHNAERAYTGLNDLSGSQKTLEDNMCKMALKLARMHENIKRIKLTDISRNSNGTGWDSKDRVDILAEMLRRGWIKLSNRKTTISDVVQKGDLIVLQRGALPKGVL